MFTVVTVYTAPSPFVCKQGTLQLNRLYNNDRTNVLRTLHVHTQLKIYIARLSVFIF